MADFYGIAGLALILLAWLWELLQLVRKRQATVPLRFALLYCAGSLLLTWHSLILDDMVFVVLNAGAALVAVANIAYGLKASKPKKSG